MTLNNDPNSMIKLFPSKASEDYVFISSNEPIAPQIIPLMTFREKEGQTYIITLEEAKANGYNYEQIWSCISLGYESDLEMTGLTAAISTALGDAKIPCNIVAAYYHDHIFIPRHLADDAMIILDQIRI